MLKSWSFSVIMDAVFEYLLEDMLYFSVYSHLSFYFNKAINFFFSSFFLNNITHTFIKSEKVKLKNFQHIKMVKILIYLGIRTGVLRSVCADYTRG